MVRAEDVVELIDWADELGVELRLDGGWGVDALLGRQTREHNDVDLFVEKRQGKKFVDALQKAGFGEELKPYTTPSHTLWRDAHDRIVDLHLFDFTSEGSYLFEEEVYPPETFGATGRIAGREVRCIPAREQVLFHLGYEHDHNDLHDVRLLCEQFCIPLPDEYT